MAMILYDLGKTFYTKNNDPLLEKRFLIGVSENTVIRFNLNVTVEIRNHISKCGDDSSVVSLEFMT